MTIEKLTDEERNILRDLAGTWATKPLRVIDALTAENERLRADNQKNANVFEELSESYLWRAESAESRIATAVGLLREAAPWRKIGTIRERLLSVLASDQPAAKESNDGR